MDPEEASFALLSLGSNLGPAGHLFDRALRLLEAAGTVSVTKRSPLARSEAMGPRQPAFTNQVALLETTLAPLALLDRMQAVERRLGRRRHRRRWGPRILDLDLLTYGGRTLLHPRLVLPHPGLGRAYLAPLLEGVGGPAPAPGAGGRCGGRAP
jgi:2-amino-4-hydroxy-6-hydroxymethyldihydropteridine diphosphokinase